MFFAYLHQPRGATSRRVEALYDCQADHHDELSFFEGQVLVVLGKEDSDWWVSIRNLTLIGTPIGLLQQL